MTANVCFGSLADLTLSLRRGPLHPTKRTCASLPRQFRLVPLADLMHRSKLRFYKAIKRERSSACCAPRAHRHDLAARRARLAGAIGAHSAISFRRFSNRSPRR